MGEGESLGQTSTGHPHQDPTFGETNVQRRNLARQLFQKHGAWIRPCAAHIACRHDSRCSDEEKEAQQAGPLAGPGSPAGHLTAQGIKHLQGGRLASLRREGIEEEED